MKHASAGALVALAGLLEQVRRVPGLKETKPGIFYRKGRAFLHFHEDKAGMFADVRVGADWKRFPVNGRAEYEVLLRTVSAFLTSS